MRWGRTVETVKVRKSNRLDREWILKLGVRPFVVTDGKAKYWDGCSVLEPALPGKPFQERMATLARTRELRLMAKEGFFPEAAGAILDLDRYWMLRETLAGYGPVAYVGLVGPTGIEMERTAEQNRARWRNL